MPPSEQEWSAPPAGRYLADVAAGACRRFRYRSRVGELLGRPAESWARPHAPVRLPPELLYRADAVRRAAEDDGWPVARPASAMPDALPPDPKPRAAVGPPARADTSGPTIVRDILLPGPAAARRPETGPSASGREATSRRLHRTEAAVPQSGSRPPATAPASGGPPRARPSPAPPPPSRSRPGHPGPPQPDIARTGVRLSGSPQPGAARLHPEQPDAEPARAAEPGPPGADPPSATQEGDLAATSPCDGDLPAERHSPIPAAVAGRAAPPQPEPVAHPATPPMAAPRPATRLSIASVAAPHAGPRADTTAPRQTSVALRPTDRRPAGPDTPDAAPPVRTDHRLAPAEPSPALRPARHRAEPPPPSATPRPIPPGVPAMPGRRPAPVQPAAVTGAPSSPTAQSQSAVPTSRTVRPTPAVQVSRRTATRAVSRWDRSTLRRVGLRGL